MNNIKKLTVFNIKDLKNKVLKLNTWSNSPNRHNHLKNGNAVAVHRNSSFIAIYDFPLEWRGNEYPSSILVSSKELIPYVQPIIEWLELYHNGKVGRCMLVKLAKNSNVDPHIDPGYYLTNCRRNHIPIVTSPEVLFNVNNTSINMLEGTCYEIDNTKVHSVNNNSSIDRIHLIVDIIPNKLLS